MQKPTATTRGFTLIEVLTTISIIVLLAAIAIPSIRVVTEANQRAQVRALISAMLTKARAYAMTHSRLAGLRFEVTSSLDNMIRSERRFIIIPVEYDPAQDLGYPMVPVANERVETLPTGIGIGRGDFGGEVGEANISDPTRFNNFMIIFNSRGQLISSDLKYWSDDVLPSARSIVIYDTALFNAQQSNHEKYVYLQKEAEHLFVNPYTGTVFKVD